jgi:hypothetical protein
MRKGIARALGSLRYLCGAVLQFREASSAVIFIPPPVIRGGKLRAAAQRNTWSGDAGDGIL